MENKDETLDKMKWIRIFTPWHIPRKYVEQLKGVNFTPDRFYQYQEKACVVGPNSALNPLNHLYVLVDKENVVKGFLWVVVDDLGQDLVIQSLSIDQNYWNKGKIIEKVTELLDPLREKANLNKILWLTRAPKHSEKYGFKRSKEVLMEFDPSQPIGKQKPLENKKEFRETQESTKEEKVWDKVQKEPAQT